MPLVPAVAALHTARRQDEAVITTMGVAREWMTLGLSPLDLVLVPSSMGQAPAWGLGMALAQPQRKVIVANGDGSMLMNLGSLVSITAEAPANLAMVLFDNGVYEVTGAQATPGSREARAGNDVDFTAIARGCGYTSVREFYDLAEWQLSVRGWLDEPGPQFAVVHVDPVPGAVGPRSPGPGPQRMRDLAAALQLPVG